MYAPFDCTVICKPLFVVFILQYMIKLVNILWYKRSNFRVAENDTIVYISLFFFALTCKTTKADTAAIINSIATS